MFGEIDLEVGPGYLHRARSGGGLLAGWSYNGFFDTAHALPVRGLVYWSSPSMVTHGSAHVSYRSDRDGWNGRGLDAGLVLDDLHALGFEVRYDHQSGADVVSLSVGWTLHTEGDETPGRKPPTRPPTP